MRGIEWALLRCIWLNVRHVAPGPWARPCPGGICLKFQTFVARECGQGTQPEPARSRPRRNLPLVRRVEGILGRHAAVPTLTVRDEAAAAGDLPPPRRPGPSIPGAPSGFDP